MKLTIGQQELADALSTVGRATSRRSTLPVLSNVLIDASTDGLSIRATDLNVGITRYVDADVAEYGSTTIPAQTFTDLVKQSPAERITLSRNGNEQIQYQCTSISANIRGIEASEFPMLPDAESLRADGATELTLPADTFAQMVDRVAFAAATDETRPVLTGCLVVLDGNILTMVAADGFRLSVHNETVDTVKADPLRLIVPANALQEVARLLDGDSVTVLVPDSQNQVLFVGSDWEVVTQLIEGNFPDYTMIIPESHSLGFSVDVDVLTATLARANVYARDAANIVRFDVQPDDEVMVVRAESAEMGDFEEPVEISVDYDEQYGAGMEIAFNSIYVRAMLSTIDSDFVVWKLNKPSSPGLFSSGDERIAWQHVIMPMHIGNR